MPNSSRLGQTGPFLVLPEHQFALAALEQLLSRRDGRTKSQLLLTLSGPSGSGKSHLLRHVLKSLPRPNGSDKAPKLVIKTASQFAAEYADAVDRQAERQFVMRHRKRVDLFVLEDIQSLASRTESQVQLVAVLDDIIAHGGGCVLTASRPVGEIRGLSRRLVNRSHGGISVHLEPLSTESRIKLVQHLAAGFQRLLTNEAAATLAVLCEHAAEMLGFLHRLDRQHAGLRKRTIDLTDVQQVLGPQPEKPEVSMEEIARAVSREFNVPAAQLRSPARSQGILIPRQVAMFLVRELSLTNFSEIGKYFGGRSHNTVMHACQRVAQQLADSPQLARQVTLLRDGLQRPQARRQPTKSKSKKR